ncbi:alcohol acetyltransferase [Bacillus ndiopicus]|uniref:alcohol acetyltransferase n=1 Tax=Bacillus ndiopicus TaxID=1347368 RepID=UPI0005A73C76|nr:alcohol acetyltransferase [Bacillus ndiopicus]
MNNWYRLDNAAKLFPAVKNKSNTAIFRVAMILKEVVQSDILQKAADLTIKRYPMLSVEIKKGSFWNYLNVQEGRVIVEEEENYPCYPASDGRLLRILYYNKRISVEIFHSLTDGSGAVEFLKTLVYQYLLLLGYSVKSEGLILLPEEMTTKCEVEDSYLKYYQPSKWQRLKEEKAFQINGTPIEPYGNNVINGVVSASQLNAIAKQEGATVTAYLTALLINSIYFEKMKYGLEDKKIIIAVPVSLRKLFPSKTLRNFFSVVNIGATVTEKTTFSMILTEVIKQLNQKVQKESLQKNISNYVQIEKNIWVRLIPLFIKNAFLKYTFDSLGDSKKTITLSNLGMITLPDEMSQYVKRMEAVVYPTPKSPINCGVCSVNDQLTITFTSRIVETEIIQYFFRYLADVTKLNVTIYSNEWGIRT